MRLWEARPRSDICGSPARPDAITDILWIYSAHATHDLEPETGMDFDVFLSHNSKDKPVVRALARRLAERGIHVWLVEDQLIPGRAWQPLLERGIERSATGAVLVGRDGLGPWEDEEMQALLRQAVTDGKPVIPVLLPGAPKQPELPLFLDQPCLNSTPGLPRSPG